MTHEAARRSVSRLWLRAFAGIVAVLAAALPASASAPVPSVQLHSNATFSQNANGRTPSSVFVTDLGVYELDTAGKSVRVWQRSDAGLELLLPDGESSFRPFTVEQFRYTTPRPQRFSGVDASGAGVAFNYPAGLAKHPTENKFAVVSGGEYRETKLVKNIPSVQVYGFTEIPDGRNRLSGLEISLEDEFREAFFTTTNGMSQIYLGDDVVTTFTTNRVDESVSTNWVYVISADPLVTRTNIWENAELPEHRPPPEPFYDFPDERFLVPTAGMEYAIRRVFTFPVDISTNVTRIPRYQYVYSTSTNSSFLASATDVAFLGDAGLVVSISDCGYTEIFNDRQWDLDHWVTNHFSVSGLAVFDASDSSKRGIVFPCATNLPGRIDGIDVDQETGDIYVAVPSASAVYRFAAPTPGDVSSWLSLDDLTVIVPDPDFSAGVPGAPGAGCGFLSGPEDVSVWRPDGASSILIVADRANDRVAAFDPARTDFAVTNWLGTTFRAVLTADGLPEDPALGFVEVVGGTSVLTNWYRVEQVAFPLFSVESSASPMNKPAGVFGQPDTNVLAVADTAGGDVRLYEVGLDALDSGEIDTILAISLFRGLTPDVGEPGISVRDFVFDTDDGGSVIACWDVGGHSNLVETGTLLTVESDETVDWIRFTVVPSRNDRTYTLSVSPADDELVVATATATVPAGETAGAFSFTAPDGVSFPWTNFVFYAKEVWPDGTTNWVLTADETAAQRVVTNVCRASPVYTATISSSAGFETNATIVVANADPAIVKGTLRGHVVIPMFGSPYVCTHGLAVEATDVAADADLTYVWWATTNIDWALNHLDWAVTNHAWASPDRLVEDVWTDLEEVVGSVERVVTNMVVDPYSQTISPVVVTERAAFFAEQTTTGNDKVVNGIHMDVARGTGMPLPFDYNEDDMLGGGISSQTDVPHSPFVAVCTVYDKDGGAAIAVFPDQFQAADYGEDRWTWSGVDEYSVSGGGGGGETGGKYVAEFTKIEGDSVTFVVKLAPGSPTPLASDTVRLEYATVLGGAWTELPSSRRVVGQSFLNGQESVEITISNAWSGDVRFFRVVQP